MGVDEVVLISKVVRKRNCFAVDFETHGKCIGNEMASNKQKSKKIDRLSYLFFLSVFDFLVSEPV